MSKLTTGVGGRPSAGWCRYLVPYWELNVTPGGKRGRPGILASRVHYERRLRNSQAAPLGRTRDKELHT